MATNPSTLPENSGRITAPDADYPYGSAKDDTTGTTGDGTPIKKALLNDTYGMMQSLLRAGVLVPSGNAETALESQVVQAIMQLAAGRAYNYDDVGAADVYILSIRAAQQIVGTIFDGLLMRVPVVNANTGASTLDMSSLFGNAPGTDVYNIKVNQAGTIDPVANDMQASQEAVFIWRLGGFVQLMNPLVSGVNQKTLSLDNLIHVQEQQASGVNAGASLVGFQQRVLNTVLRNTIVGASLAANAVTLPAGDYYVEASAHMSNVDTHQCGLYNAPDAAFLVNGTSENATQNGAGDAVGTRSLISGFFSLAATKNIWLRHYGSSVGFLGTQVGTGEPEVYSDLKIWRVS